MKKIIMSSLVGLLLIGAPIELVKADEKVSDDNMGVVSRGVIVKKWFSGQPPTTYKGKSLINSYYYNKGYMGIYK